MTSLINYSWPGNIRELEHIIERNIVLQHSNSIDFIELPQDIPTEPLSSYSTVQNHEAGSLDKEHIIEALKACNGKVAGTDGAADMLGISPTSLHSKMKKMGIKWKFDY
jgi:transcriptional regulator of acetoin/glycerol metabolism